MYADFKNPKMVTTPDENCLLSHRDKLIIIYNIIYSIIVTMTFSKSNSFYYKYYIKYCVIYLYIKKSLFYDSFNLLNLK